MFGKAATIWRIGESAAIVQKLLEYHGRGTPTEGAARAIAHNLVQSVKNAQPDLVHGKAGSRPHKVSLAAVSLANGASKLAASDPQREHFLCALEELVFGVAKNEHSLAFTSVDHALLKASIETLDELRGGLFDMG